MAKKWSKSKILMNVIAIISTLLTIILYIMDSFLGIQIIEILNIILLVISFHLDIRIVIGNIIPRFKSKINVNNKWFKSNEFENKIYKAIKVKKWKAKAPTYELDEFNIEKHTYEEILVNMCNSEIVHETNIFVSYISLLFIIWLGKPIIFIIASIISSFCDLQFVIIQRYNRDRIMKIINKKSNTNLKSDLAKKK